MNNKTIEVQINFKVLPDNYAEYENALFYFLNDLDNIIPLTKDSIVVDETEIIERGE